MANFEKIDHYRGMEFQAEFFDQGKWNEYDIQVIERLLRYYPDVKPEGKTPLIEFLLRNKLVIKLF